MNENLKRAIRAYLNLNPTEQREFEIYIERYKRMGEPVKLSEKRSFSLGPMDANKCGCCGK